LSLSPRIRLRGVPSGVQGLASSFFLQGSALLLAVGRTVL